MTTFPGASGARPRLPLAPLTLAGLGAGLALAAGVAPVGAQSPTVDVGHPPAQSPYRDVLWKQETTVFSGYFAAASDPAGVAPRSGPMVGVRYDIRLAGPANFYARLAAVNSERTVINPAALPAARDLGTEGGILALADVGIALNVTGQKSWHRLVPVVSAGLGVATDFEGEDVGGYKFGTPFALNFGAGVRYVPGGRFQLRVDVADHLYQIRYPSTYYQTSSPTVDPVLSARQKQNIWKHNVALTIGVSYLLGR